MPPFFTLHGGGSGIGTNFGIFRMGGRLGRLGGGGSFGRSGSDGIPGSGGTFGIPGSDGSEGMPGRFGPPGRFGSDGIPGFGRPGIPRSDERDPTEISERMSEKGGKTAV